VFNALFEQGVALEGILLKPNMVVAGKECSSSQRDKPPVEHEALENQFLLRAGASRSGARGMAWT
jgi:fructose-bisphosphate aldolase class 1